MWAVEHEVAFLILVIRYAKGFDYSHYVAEKMLQAGVMRIGTEAILVRRPRPRRFNDESIDH